MAKVESYATCKKKEQTVKEQIESKIAWEIWNVISDLQDVIWHRYEKSLIDLYLEEEHQNFLESQVESQTDDVPF